MWPELELGLLAPVRLSVAVVVEEGLQQEKFHHRQALPRWKAAWQREEKKGKRCQWADFRVWLDIKKLFHMPVH